MGRNHVIDAVLYERGCDGQVADRLTRFQAGMLALMLDQLYARTSKPLWEPDGYSLPGYCDWMPDRVARTLRYIERNPTDGDSIDPSPNEHALWLITIMRGYITETLVNAGLLCVLPYNYLTNRKMELDKRERERQARRTRDQQAVFDSIVGPKRWQDRPGARIVRHRTVADMTADSGHFYTAEQLMAEGAAMAPTDLRCVCCGERARYVKDLYPRRRSPRTRFIGHCGRKRCPLEALGR